MNEETKKLLLQYLHAKEEVEGLLQRIQQIAHDLDTRTVCLQLTLTRLHGAFKAAGFDPDEV